MWPGLATDGAFAAWLVCYPRVSCSGKQKVTSG
jgi:hypothetical protein